MALTVSCPTLTPLFPSSSLSMFHNFKHTYIFIKPIPLFSPLLHIPPLSSHYIFLWNYYSVTTINYPRLSNFMKKRFIQLTALGAQGAEIILYFYNNLHMKTDQAFHKNILPSFHQIQGFPLALLLPPPGIKTQRSEFFLTCGSLGNDTKSTVERLETQGRRVTTADPRREKPPVSICISHPPVLLQQDLTCPSYSESILSGYIFPTLRVQFGL